MNIRHCVLLAYNVPNNSRYAYNDRMNEIQIKYTCTYIFFTINKVCIQVEMYEKILLGTNSLINHSPLLCQLIGSVEFSTRGMYLCGTLKVTTYKYKLRVCPPLRVESNEAVSLDKFETSK
jgi:hypothetical protein